MVIVFLGNKLTENEASNKIIISKQKESENIKKKNKTVFIEKYLRQFLLQEERCESGVGRRFC